MKYFFKIKINFRIIGKSNINLNKHFINQNSFNQILKKIFKIFIYNFKLLNRYSTLTNKIYVKKQPISKNNVIFYKISKKFIKFLNDKNSRLKTFFIDFSKTIFVLNRIFITFSFKHKFLLDFTITKLTIC